MIQPRAPSQILVPLGLAVCLSLFGDLTLYAVLVTQLDVVGLSLAAVGVMLSVNRLIRIPGNPLTGVLLDLWGRRRLFIFGMVLGAYATVGDVGSMAGPFLAFAMLSVVDLQRVYLLCAFSFLVGLGLIWRTRPNPKSQDGPTF